MSLNKCSYLAGILMVATSLMEERLSAADYSSDSWIPQSLQMKVCNEMGYGNGSIARAQVSSGTNQFCFTMPADYRMGNSTSRKISLVSADYSHELALSIAGPTTYAARNLTSDYYRSLLLTRFPGAKITEEFPRNAANQAGIAFDFQWRNPAGIWLSARVAYFPSPAGVLEFSLTSANEKFSNGKISFDSWLLTFSSKEAGKHIVDTST